MKPTEKTRVKRDDARGKTMNMMFLCDVNGRILYWSGPSHPAAGIADPTGQHLSQWLPALPMRSETPGYNLAFVRMVFHDGQWQSSQLRMPDGTVRPVQVYLQAIALDRGYWLTGVVRAAPAATAAQLQDKPRPARARSGARIPIAGDRRLMRSEVLPPLLLDFSRAHSERRADRLSPLAP